MSCKTEQQNGNRYISLIITLKLSGICLKIPNCWRQNNELTKLYLFIIRTGLALWSDLGQCDSFQEKKGQAMTNNDKMIRANFAFILFIIIAVCVNLNTRVRILETSNSELQQTIQTQKDEIEKIEEKNTMQDVIINKLNNDYNSRMAQELQEVADENGVGG